MIFLKLKRTYTIFVLLVVLLTMTSCDDDFYLSENEVKSYESIFASESILNQHFDNLQGRTITLTFNNSTGTPKLQSTNLLTEMRRTELANLETNASAVSLNRLKTELEEQISKWIEGRLALYTNGATSDKVRLTELNTVTVTFLNNPKFTFHPEKQTINYDLSLKLVMNGEIEVNAVNWLINIFTNINGTYPLEIEFPILSLQGEASIYSPSANGGRIRFKMMPQVLSPVQVKEIGTSIPNQVQQGIEQVMTHNLSKQVDEIFIQDYDHFAIANLRLTSETNSNPSRLETFYRPKAEWLGTDAPNPQIHIVSRDSNGRLQHARKSNGNWSEYTPVPMPAPSSTPHPHISNDPTLTYSGKGQMELAVTNQAGDLLYSHWRDEKWGNTYFAKPNNGIRYEGKPAVTASASGQAEIIVAGSDGNLWHLRRINGFWQSPNIVPTINTQTIAKPYRDPVTVYVGNKIVTVFADSQNHLFAITYDLETNFWGQQTEFRTSSNAQITTNFAPAVVASGENQVDVVYVKPNGSIFHQVLNIQAINFQSQGSGTGISFSNYEKQIPGSSNATPALTVASYKQPELVVRGNDNHLYHNHFVNALSSFTVDGKTVNPGWQGWTNLDKFIYSNSPKTDAKVSEFSAAGTYGGKTEIIARGLPKYSYMTHLNFHNEFESNRFARNTNPWKTVGWRGWDATSSSQQFFGRPAVAAFDRSFQIANIGNRQGFGTTLHNQRLGETNQTYLLGATLQVSTNSPLIDPVILPTGPGMFDTFVLLKSGKLQHTRYYSNGTSYPQNLTTPTGVKIVGISATTYGNGFVDLAATTSDSRIHFWRYRGGFWSQPTIVANQIISAPILKHTGAGQLELLGIEFDYNLRRFRYAENAWQNPLGISHNFQIDDKKFSSVSASSWGDGSVDLIVADLNSSKLYHRRIGPGNWTCTQPFGCPPPRTFKPIGGISLESPVLTAFSPTNLNVLAMQGLRWYNSWASAMPFQPYPAPRDPVIKWSSFNYIGGDEMVVSGTAHSGRSNFAAIGVKEGKFYINRNENWNWTGFQPIIGQKPEQVIKTPIFLPAITSHSH